MQLNSNISARSEQITRAILLALLFTGPALMCFAGARAVVGDPDLGWQITTGQWILQHHAFPQADPFSRLAHGAPWQAYSWLFDLILVKLYSWFGLDGIVAYTAIMVTANGVAIWRLVNRLQPDFLKSALLTLGAVFSMSRMYTPRPWLITIFFFALELDILLRYRSSGRTRTLFWLVPLFALWANIHIQFIDGLLVLALAAAEPLIVRWLRWGSQAPAARPLWIAFGACILATFLNPYGVTVYRSAWILGSQPGVLNTITEMHAMTFRTDSDFVLLFLALGAAGVLFRYRNLAPFETLLLSLSAVLAFRSQRDLWMLAIVAVAILAAGIPEGASERKPLAFWTVPITTGLCTAVVAVAAVVMHLNNSRMAQLEAKSMPVQAVEVIQQRHYDGALFNTYGWGGFLIWKLGEPVSIDGRAGLYGDEVISRSMDTWAGNPKWSSNPELTSAKVVIGPADSALTQLLLRDPRFDLAYEDSLAAIFTRHGWKPNATGSVAALHPEGAPSTPEKHLQ
ncbi:MAG TPA: hypothetical protein VMD25_01015 [Acidobacteriaceae bacterium]|nr:hypothetical protein [Acidobacteriaceae bacterium]